MENVKEGQRVIIFHYYSKNEHEYGEVDWIGKNVITIFLDNGIEYCGTVKSKGYSWDTLEDMDEEFLDELEEVDHLTAEQFKSYMEKALDGYADRKLKQWINEEMPAPDVLTKKDFQEMLDKALDSKDYEEAYRIAKKMEGM